MSIVSITGAAGLVGTACAQFFISEGFSVIGIDNDMRRTFFGPDASTISNRTLLEGIDGYKHVDTDIRDTTCVSKIFEELKRDISIIIHAAAQPSHDWAREHPLTDFSKNATATLHLL